MHDLPNHVFDASSPARRITASQRVTSLVTKAAELGAVGTITGVAMSGLAQVCLLSTIATSYSQCQTENTALHLPWDVPADEPDNLH